MDWYSKVYVCVRWGDCMSCFVQLVSGVRQGGVLSPVLFVVYVNDIILKVSSSGHGCCIGDKYVGMLMYADDLLLISASCHGLRCMISICEQEVAWLDMRFNVGKSCFVRIGSRHSKPCSDLQLNGTVESK